MASHIVGYPRMGPKRELKFALESFWDGKSSAEDLQKVSADLRSSIWKQQAEAGIKYIPSNTFSYYDQVLDTTALLGAVPPRYGWNGGEIGFDTYFSMARGNASVPAMEMTKWFDTNYHFIVPELGPDVKFSYASHKAVTEYKEAKGLGIETVPVLVGPVSYLLLSKPAKGVEKNFSLLSLLGKILPIYKEVVSELKAAGASWIQFDEPTLILDLDSHQLKAFTDAYSELASSLSGLNVLIETYFADIPAEAFKTLTALKGVTAFGFDLVRGTKTLDLIKTEFPKGKYLFAGVVDGRNIWANDLAASLSTLHALEGIVGKDKLVVSTSCSLLHTAVDLVNETKLDKEIKSWLAFAAQKVVEVNALSKALAGHKDEAFFSANAAALASRKSSPRVTNESVQKAAAALKGSDHRRVTNVSARLDAQQKKLNLPILPTTTIGSFPQTIELRRVRREYKAKKISEEEYDKAIKEEINKVVKLQEELDIDVLVHGEPERNDINVIQIDEAALREGLYLPQQKSMTRIVFRSSNSRPMAKSEEMLTPIRFYTVIKSAEDLIFRHSFHQNLILGSESGLYVDAFILDDNDDSLNQPTHKKTPIVGIAMNPEWNHLMGFIIEFGDADKGFLTLVSQIKIKANVNEVDDILIAEVRVNIKELLDKDPDNADGEKHLSFVVTSPSGEAKGLLNFCFKFRELIFPFSHALPAAESAAPVAGHGDSATSFAAYPPPRPVFGGCPTWSYVVQPPPYQYPEQQSRIGRLARSLAARVGSGFLAHEVLNWASSGEDFGLGGFF